MSFKRSFSLTWGRYWPCKSCWNTTKQHISLSFNQFFLDLLSWILLNKLWFSRWLWTPFLHLNELYWSTIFPWGKRWKINFLSLLVAFSNTATRRHSKIKHTRSATNQQFSGEALSKQNIKAWLTLFSCSSSQAPTEWSAIFPFGVFKNFTAASALVLLLLAMSLISGFTDGKCSWVCGWSDGKVDTLY